MDEPKPNIFWELALSVKNENKKMQNNILFMRDDFRSCNLKKESEILMLK
jgi:hypothetical protein